MFTGKDWMKRGMERSNGETEKSELKK